MKKNKADANQHTKDNQPIQKVIVQVKTSQGYKSRDKITQNLCSTERKQYYKVLSCHNWNMVKQQIIVTIDLIQ